MAQETKFFPLQGGLNLVTPSIRTPGGHVIAGVNYEPVEKGYQRVQGYERFDGQPKPSDAAYWVLNFDAGTDAINEGDTVTGAGSGATGKALIDAVITSGSYAGNDAAGYLVLTGVSATSYDNDENLQVSAATKMVADGTETLSGASNDTDDATWQQDAIETARTLIAAVPGSGVMRGIWFYNGDAYGFRDNAGGTAVDMYKSSTSGWALQSLGLEIDFTSGGTYVMAEGVTVEGETGGATAVVRRVVIQSGTMAGGDAAGYLVLSGQTGTFQSETLKVGANLDVMSIAGDSSAITLPVAGRYEFHNYNFYGASNLYRMYGANGVGKAFEWDGTIFGPIRSGMTLDTPEYVQAHKKHLFLSFPGGSVQHSGIGAPYTWSVVLGASEIAVGQDCTGLLSDVAGLLTIFGRNYVGALYGTDSTSWVLEDLATDAGAIARSAQRIGVPIYQDDRGLRNLRSTQAYGDFVLGTITRMIEPLFKAKKKAAITTKASIRVRAKDQYRLFWDNKTGITVYLGRKVPEILPFEFLHNIECACSAEDSNGDEVLFFGGDDGFVYQIDSGTSYDGAAIDGFCRLAFNNVGSPTHEKRWHKAVLDVDAPVSATIKVSAEFSYGDPDRIPVPEVTFAVAGGGGFWDEANWDDFYWSSQVVGQAEADIPGIGINVSLAIATVAIYEEPHTIHGLTLHYSMRRLKR